MMDEARSEALHRAEETDKPCTYMMVPKESIDHLSITMVPMGIVAKATTTVMKEGLY